MGRDRDDRKRSRSRERDRSRDRDKRKKDDKKEKDRNRSRDRSRSRERNKDKKDKKHRHRSRSRSKDKKDSPVIEEEQTLDAGDEMKKRRERLKAWQEAKAKESSVDPVIVPLSKVEMEVESYIQKLQSQKQTDETNTNETKEEDVVVLEKGLGWLEEEGEDDEEGIIAKDIVVPFTLSSEETDVLKDLRTVTTVTGKEGFDEENNSTVFKHFVMSSSSSSSITNVKVTSLGKTRRSKWSSSDKDVKTSPSPRSIDNNNNMTTKVVKEDDDDEDPLDAFMNNLYSSGDVETQRDLMSTKTSKSVEVITMDEILSSMVMTKDNNNEKKKKKKTKDHDPVVAGWESDTGGGGGEDDWSTSSSPSHIHSSSNPLDVLLGSVFDADGGLIDQMNETDEQRDEREERERKEFIDAIRRARQEEETMRQKLKNLTSSSTSTSTSLVVTSSTGRVFAEEGDVLEDDDQDDEGQTGLRKTALEIYEETRRGKSMREVDHSLVDYLSFRKNLYIVPKALSRLNESEVMEKREDLHVKVRGKGCPCPVDSWEQCGLSDRVLSIIQLHKLQEPFPIQKQAIPAIMAGRDVIGIAKTGSGKTLAFLLPMIRHILDQPPLRDNEGPIGLILAPARELAFQIGTEAKKLTRPLGMRVTCVYGGASVSEQISDLKRGAEIVVCTPGRMIEILCMQAGRLVSLQRVTMVVMDEADRMFDMGFEPQIKMILQNIRPDRQTVLFSATFPKQIEKLAKTVLRLPLEIVVGERSTVNKDITQFVEVHEEEDKFLRLLQLLGLWYEKGSVLVFVDKQEKCDQLFQELLKLGYPCLSLHGGKEQADRDHTLHEFKTGIKTVMIATSVAGRGLDVPDIVCVVNYACPNHLEDYVHRVGRTGRAGRKGTAYTFISSKEEQYAATMAKALEKAKQPVPLELSSLVSQFKQKVDRGEAVQHGGGGFVGKGFTFDSSEMNDSQRQAAQQRRVYELEQGLLEPEEATDLLLLNMPQSGTYSLDEDDNNNNNNNNNTNSNEEINNNNNNKSKTIDPSLALARAKLIAQQMDSITAASCAILGQTDDRMFHCMDELEINDYPAQARRKASHRNTIEEIVDRTGVAICTRGVYVVPGKRPEPGERKLHLLIEGPTELSVRQAKSDLQRVLDEETIRLGTMGGGSGGGGRYSVL